MMNNVLFRKLAGFLGSFFFSLLVGPSLLAQSIDALINAKEVEKIERVISSDDMQGRASFSAGIEKAADFISEQFKEAGLQPFGKDKSFRQTFSMIKAKTL